MYEHIWALKRISMCLILSVLLILIPIPGLTAVLGTVIQQEDYTKLLEQAEEMYNTGRFDDAEKVLVKSLEAGQMDRGQKMQAYRLLGLTYIAKDFEQEARAAVKKLLEMVPNYNPDPVQDPPLFRAMIIKMQKESQVVKAIEPVGEEQKKTADNELEQIIQREKAKKGKNKWLVIGGGLAAAGGIILLLFSQGGDGGGTFPLPPARPGSP